MTQRSIRGWYLVHKWTSLICTAFLLTLCVSGLVLIFHDELEELLGYNAPLEQVAPGMPAPSLDEIVAKALAARPAEVVQYVAFDEDRPIAYAITAPAASSPDNLTHEQPIDLRTGKLLSPAPHYGILDVVLELHTELFVGLPGKLFLGVMGILFVAAIVSGIVVYVPFMRKLDFATVRRGRSTRLKWLDLHNLLGIAIVAWLSVVGVTGVFNTLDPLLAEQWRSGQLADMTAPYRGAAPLRRIGSLDAAIDTARRTSPDMDVSLVYYPGSFFSTPHHYNVFMRGRTAVTAELLKPTLVDAETAELTDTRDLPLHIRALFLSRPLHFGDYGGLVLKLVWAALDIVAIIILGSGLYLWLGRRRRPIESRIEKFASRDAGELV